VTALGHGHAVAPLPASLLGGMDQREFFASHWRRRFLLVPGGARHLLDRMPSVADVEALLDRSAHPDEDLLHYLSFPRDGNPATRSWTAVPPTHTAGRDRAEAVNLAPAARWFPDLEPLANAFGRAFGSAANLQLFWAPTDGRVPAHRDANDSFVIQIAGRKRWHGEDIADGRPRVSGNAGGTLGDNAHVFDLEPGDVLYKPSHAVHETTSADEPTLSLTCSISTSTAADVLLSYLRAQLDADPVWLERLPLVQGPDGSDDDKARARLEAALGDAARHLPELVDLERWVRP